jgi:hypothetical protein
MLYEPDAALAFPSRDVTVGREAIRAHFEPEDPLPTLRTGNLALTSTRRRSGKRVRVQVTRRQPDGTWLRVFDWPEPPSD